MFKKQKEGQEQTEEQQSPQEEAPKELVVVPKERLEKLLRYHVWSSITVGLIPLPVVDFAAVTAIQINLLRKLAKEYKVPFFKDSVKETLSALLGGVIPATASGPLAMSLAKAIPGIGTTAGVVTMPILGGATTYATGKVFIQHFASGGTFLSFDPEKVKAYYEDMLKEGHKVAVEMKDDLAASDESK